MNKSIVVKLLLCIVLIGLFVVQNIVLFSSLAAFVTQQSIDTMLCGEYAKRMDQKYSSSIDVAFIIGFISLSVSLAFIFLANNSKSSNNT